MLGRLCLLASLLIVAAGSAAAQVAPAPVVPPDLDAVVARAMSAFKIPGLGLAIVKDGRVVAVKGYGVRRLGSPARVDGATRFAIASNSKLFTAVALALLVEEGKLEWDAPVIRYLPWFQMVDPYVTRELTVRDLLVHRSGLGLGAGDLLMFPKSTLSRREIVRRLRHVPLATSFRSRYAYDNLLYLAAGEVVEAVSGRSWEDFVAARILKRLGMTDSSPRMSSMAAPGNAAAAHSMVEGALRPVPHESIESGNPAGGVTTSARDLAKWLLALSGEGGLPDGTRLFSAASMRELATLVTPMPVVPPPPELAPVAGQFRGYALGLVVTDYRGQKLVTHDGGLLGQTSRVALLPSRRLGFAIVTNQESTAALNAVGWYLLDHYLGAPRADWVAALTTVTARRRAEAAAVVTKAAATRNRASRPSLPLAAYAGTYRDVWYGDLTIAEDQGRLVLRSKHSPGLIGDLEHWQYDTFVARWRDRTLNADAYVTFALDHAGVIEQVRMRAISPETDFSFDFHDLVLKPVRPRGR